MENEQNGAGYLPLQESEPQPRVLTPGQLVARRFFRNKLAISGLVILILMIAFSFLGGMLTPYRQSQVFQHDEAVQKEYASATQSTELRFSVQTASTLSADARAQALLAVSQGNNTFSSLDQLYFLTQEGEDVYSVSERKPLARARLIAGTVSWETVAGADFTATPEVTAAAETAIAARQDQFTAGGVSYSIQSEGKTFVVSRQQTIALATKRVYDAFVREDAALVSGLDFRLMAERAIVAGETAFLLDGVRYELIRNREELAVYRLQGGEQVPVCTISDILVSATDQNVFLGAEMQSAVRAAIRAKETAFVYSDSSGEPKNLTLERVNNAYLVRTLAQSRVITMYAPPSREHLLGTDGNGMDVLTRLMYGGRVSLMVGIIVVLIQSLIGVTIGGISGYFGGWVDTALMRLIDLVNSIPFYPLVIIVGTVLDQMQTDPEKRIFILMAVLGLLGWTNVARVVRGQILSLREQDFMLAAEATGLRASRKILSHLIPNVMPLMIVQATLSLGGIIITEATLSFLGLGVKYPLASWGSIINAATDVHIMTNDPFVWIPAGALIVLTVLGFNFVGDGLRDAFDPRMKR